MLLRRSFATTLLRHIRTKPTVLAHADTSHHVSSFQTPSYRSFFSSKDRSDCELQESFQRVLPKIVWTLQVLFTDAGLASYEALNEKGLLGPSPKSVHIFALLQNPLLAKYGFDPAEFIVGAALAYKRYSLASLSAEFLDFANGRLKTSAAATLVRQSVWEAMYDANIFVCKEVDGGPGRVLESFDLSKSQICFVKTTLIEDSSEDSLINKWDIRKFSDLKSPYFQKKSFFRYPVGSVVTTVGVKFMVTGSYRYYVRGKMQTNLFKKKWSTELDTQILRYDQVTFEGCISGHAPLEWKIANYNTIGFE